MAKWQNSTIEESQRAVAIDFVFRCNRRWVRDVPLTMKSWRGTIQVASGQSIAGILQAHDAKSTSSSKAQYRVGKLVNRVRYDRYVATLEQLPETSPPRGTGDPHGEKEARGFAKARRRSQSGPEFFQRLIRVRGRALSGERSFWRRGAPAAMRRTRTRGMRVCVVDRARMSNQHQPLVHALSRTLERMSIRNQAESGAPFNAERDLRMDIVIERGGLRDATAAEYRNKAILLDVTCADPHACRQR